MFAVNVLPCLNKSFSTGLRAIVSSLKHIRLNSTKPKVTSYNIKTHTEKDVVLFKLEKPNFFRFITLFSVLQCGCWTYLGLFLFQSLRKTNINTKGQQFWAKVLEKEKKYSNSLTFFSVIFGWSVLAATTFYCFRSIRKIILHKGGNSVTVVTYGLPGYNVVEVPLSHVSSLEHRIRAKKYIPVKVKNKYFYYLIDVNGEFLNPTLFDFTAGIKRGFQ